MEKKAAEEKENEMKERKVELDYFRNGDSTCCRMAHFLRVYFLKLRNFFQEQEKASKRLRRERVFMHAGGN